MIIKLKVEAEEEFLKAPLHDTGNAWYAVAAFFLPIIGLIVAQIFKHHRYYRNYKSLKKGGVIGLIVRLVIIVIFVLLLVLAVI